MIRLQDTDERVRRAEYAVRGPIVARAMELVAAGRPVVFCNIGNPQAVGQRPLTWFRQVLALCEWPALAERAPAGLFPDDVVETARRVLAGSEHGLGAYSEAKGLRLVRAAVAEFIAARDGVAADPDTIYLTDGASKAVQAVLRMLVAGPGDGVMIPIPQYPLYSATLTLYGATAIPYHLAEADHWQLDGADLEGALAEARARGITPRAICVINPGNPTGSVLSAATLRLVLDLARRHGLSILADEVYQENLHADGARFVSFAQVLGAAGEREVSLFSFHSVSKGILGECGHRGGYVECRNVPADVLALLTKLQSIALCANLPGQVATYLMVCPPRPGDPSYPLWHDEREAVRGGLQRKARILAEGLDAIPGIACDVVEGAMYAFPRITLPPGRTDEEWCHGLLEERGICVVPGSGFGQAPGTAHFRTTILPPVDQIEQVVRDIAAFHGAWR